MIDNCGSRLERYERSGAWVIVGLICILYLIRTNSILWYRGGDDMAHYILLAKAIATGEGYRDNFIPGAPVHTQYPPLFPLLLSIIIAVRGMDLFSMKLTVSLAAATTLLLTYLLLRRQSLSWPLASVVWLGCSYRFFTHSDLLLTETPYMAFSIATILCFDKWLKFGKWKDAMLTVISLWACEMTRTAGITLAAAIGAAIFLQKGKSGKRLLKAISVTIISLVPALIWGIRGAMLSAGGMGYLSQLLYMDPYAPAEGTAGPIQIAGRFLMNARSYFLDIAELIAGDRNLISYQLDWVIAAPLAALVVIGFIRRFRKSAGVMEAYVIFFTALVFLWPFHGYRYILPVYPFIIAYTVEGAHTFADWLSGKGPRWRRVSLLSFGILFFMTISFNTWRDAKYWADEIQSFKTDKIRISDNIYVLTNRDSYRHMLQACVWLAENGQPGAVAMARNFRIAALASGHPILRFPVFTPQNPKKMLKDFGVRYILVDEAYPNAADFMNYLTRGGKDIQGLQVVFSEGRTIIVEITPAFFEKKQ